MAASWFTRLRSPLCRQTLCSSQSLVSETGQLCSWIPNLPEFCPGFLFKLDSIFYRIYLRSEEIYSMPLQISQGQTLTIVVENQGRICYGPEIADRF